MTSTNRGIPTTYTLFNITYRSYEDFLHVDLTHVTMVRPFFDADNTFVCTTNWEGFLQTVHEIASAMHLEQISSFSANTVEHAIETV